MDSSDQDRQQLTHEAELIAAAAAGDEASLARIVQTHADSVFRIARAMVGSDADADDAVQEVFLRAFRSLDRFRGTARLSTWLHRITVNVALSLREKQRGIEGRHQRAAEQLPRANPPGPGEAIERSELQAAVRDMLEELPPEQRAVVVLRELEGLPTSEVAAVLECPVPTVESRLSRARARMRELWKKFDPER